jgi:hypothetical protein
LSTQQIAEDDGEIKSAKQIRADFRKSDLVYIRSRTMVSPGVLDNLNASGRRAARQSHGLKSTADIITPRPGRHRGPL